MQIDKQIRMSDLNPNRKPCRAALQSVLYLFPHTHARNFNFRPESGTAVVTRDDFHSHTSNLELEAITGSLYDW